MFRALCSKIKGGASMKAPTLSILIAAVALLSSIRGVAQSPTPFTETFNFPGTYNIALPQVSPCCLWNWAITPLQVSSSISGGIIQVTNISVSGNVTIQGQPVGGFDWDVLVGA